MPAELRLKISPIIYVVVILAFNIAAELQIILDNILERFLPVPKKIKLRFFLQISVGILFLYVALRGIMYFVGPKLTLPDSRSGVVMGMVTGLVFVQMVANSLTIARFTQKWFDSQEQIAEMRREKLSMDYNSLQDQLNPHFLFNNLSVLKSLIIYDPDVAVEFTENFTDVYRYVLQSKDKRLVKLGEELDFINAYCALHKERLGEGINVDSLVPINVLDKDIAPLTGQLLIENAIKHNITSRETPLQIKVYVEGDCLVVSNSLNRREVSYSTKTGLKNLVKRYEILTEKEIVVQYDESRFEVKVPLL
jgi:LytS/YehU family sensor histidine kinase